MNAARVKCLTMYSNITSSRPHYACDVTPGSIFSCELFNRRERDDGNAGVTPVGAAGNSRGPRKETCKYYNKRKNEVRCSAVCRGGRDSRRPILGLTVAVTQPIVYVAAKSRSGRT